MGSAGRALLLDVVEERLQTIRPGPGDGEAPIFGIMHGCERRGPSLGAWTLTQWTGSGRWRLASVPFVNLGRRPTHPSWCPQTHPLAGRRLGRADQRAHGVTLPRHRHRHLLLTAAGPLAVGRSFSRPGGPSRPGFARVWCWHGRHRPGITEPHAPLGVPVRTEGTAQGTRGRRRAHAGRPFAPPIQQCS